MLPDLVITHKGCRVDDYAALVSRYGRDDLRSPYRSTVPLLAYWKDAALRLAELADSTGAAFDRPVTLGFEHAVPVQEGRGKPSYTDLMLCGATQAVGIEAKYTEPMYESVETWLGTPRSANREAVVRGWLAAISRTAGCELAVDGVLDCTYQAVHRTASACVVGKDARSVVYMLFHHDDRELASQIEKHEACLARLAGCLGTGDQVALWVYGVPLKRSAEYEKLQARWDRERPRPYLDEPIREGLLSGALMEFGTPTVRAV